MLANERYAFELDHIRGVYPLNDITWIPGIPEFILGIINVRGEIISINDLKKFFDLPDQDQTSDNHVIILTSKHMEFGILADAIIGVTKIEEKRIQPSLPTLSGIRAQFLKGVTGDGIVILDALKILEDKKMNINIEGGK